MTIDVTARPGGSLSGIGECMTTVIEKLLAGGVTEREIEAAYNGKEAQIARRLTTSLGIANGLATSWTLTGDAENFDREIERFQGITPDEILAAARQVFSATACHSASSRGRNRTRAEPPEPGGERLPDRRRSRTTMTHLPFPPR